MHGIIFNQLRQYILARLGPCGWLEVTEQAGVSSDSYRLGEIYPDEEMLVLVKTASARTGVPIPALLEDFGAFLAPALLRIYEPLIDPAWKILDILEHTESAIHTVVRLRDHLTAPPILVSRRPSLNEVTIQYQSGRRLCYVAKGIIHGLAEHFHQRVSVDEQRCMHKGADQCFFSVKLES